MPVLSECRPVFAVVWAGAPLKTGRGDLPVLARFLPVLARFHTLHADISAVAGALLCLSHPGLRTRKHIWTFRTPVFFGKMSRR